VVDVLNFHFRKIRLWIYCSRVTHNYAHNTSWLIIFRSWTEAGPGRRQCVLCIYIKLHLSFLYIHTYATKQCVHFMKIYANFSSWARKKYVVNWTIKQIKIANIPFAWLCPMSDDKLPTLCLIRYRETDLALFDCNTAIISDIFVLCHWIFLFFRCFVSFRRLNAIHYVYHYGGGASIVL
jgi:hypothetical protein